MQKIIILMATLLFISGCAVHEQMVPKIELAPTQPVNKISKYSNALEQLGEMMESFEEAQFAVMAEPIEDKTGSGAGKLPQDLTMVVESALQNVGETMLVMPYGERGIQLANRKTLSLYMIHGAITEFDAATTSSGTGGNVGLFYKEIDLGAESSQNMASGTIAMDFMILDATEGYYVPGVKATAKATIEQKTKDRGFTFSIIGNGFGLNGTTTVQTPLHHVVNLMVEYCMVQIIGKLNGYPYWLVIHGSDPDYRQIKKMAKGFARKSNEQKNVNISYILNILNPHIKSSQIKLDTYTKQHIVKYKRQFGIIPPDPRVTTEFYIKLLSEGPKLVKQQGIFNEADAMLDNVLQ